MQLIFCSQIFYQILSCTGIIVAPCCLVLLFLSQVFCVVFARSWSFGFSDSGQGLLAVMFGFVQCSSKCVFFFLHILIVAITHVALSGHPQHAAMYS